MLRLPRILRNTIPCFIALAEIKKSIVISHRDRSPEPPNHPPDPPTISMNGGNVRGSTGVPLKIRLIIPVDRLLLVFLHMQAAVEEKAKIQLTATVAKFCSLQE